MVENYSQEHIEHIKKIVQTAMLMIENAENNLKKAKWMLHNLSQLGSTIGNLDAIVEEVKLHYQDTQQESSDHNWQIIYGEFDGYFMLGSDLKKYPVPLNYSSKSKLVPGDKLKLTITDNGQLVYKLITPCERKHIRAVLSKDDQDSTKFIAITADGDNYTLNQAAVTFFKWRPGDEIYIITNKKGDSHYAAIEAVIRS